MTDGDGRQGAPGDGLAEPREPLPSEVAAAEAPPAPDGSDAPPALAPDAPVVVPVSLPPPPPAPPAPLDPLRTFGAAVGLPVEPLRGRAPEGDRSVLGALRDNLEAIAFALILALLLRHFCIEVFKIPTASMEPTLFGDGSHTHPGTGGDRILVDKLAYLFHGPERWDVVVFHYPLDWSRNFIKRVTGLPGELLRIERGDVWTARPEPGVEPSFHPARKPRRVREQLYAMVYPPTDAVERARPSDYWRTDRAPSWQVASYRELVFGGDAPGTSPETAEWAVLKYGFPITSLTSAERPRDTSGNHVSDVRWRGEVEVSGPAELEVTWRPGDGRNHQLRLATEDRPASMLRSKDREVPIARRLVPGKAVEVALESVDGDVRAWFDGDEVAVVSDELPIAEATQIASDGPRSSQELLLAARGAGVVVKDARVDRDVYYLGGQEQQENVPHRGEAFPLGPDQHFMMGDNTYQSSDSRKWQARGRRLRDGRTIWWDWQSSPHTVEVDGRRLNEVTDVDGIVRTWSDDDRDPDEYEVNDRRSVVTRDRIIGKAFFALVFWPLDENFPERVRFIH